MNQFEQLLADNAEMRDDVALLRRVFPAAAIWHTAPYYNGEFLVDNYPVCVERGAVSLDSRFDNWVTVSGVTIYWHKQEFYRRDNFTPPPAEPRQCV